MAPEARKPNPVLVRINLQNEKFWQEQRILRDRRMADPAILATAVADMTSELSRNVPVRAQKIFEAALADAEAAKQRFISERARTAGRVKKSDPLQTLIEKMVLEKPAITSVELRRLINNHADVEPIEEVTSKAVYVTRPNGTAKKVPLTGLKHRLSRAKKKLKKT
jgi:hypothetical protein